MPGRRKLQFAVHLDDRLLRLAAGNVAAADDFAGNQFARLRVVLQPRFLKINRLALEQRQQQFLRDRVVAVILLEDLQRMFAGRVAQDDRVRLHLRGGAGVSARC